VVEDIQFHDRRHVKHKDICNEYPEELTRLQDQAVLMFAVLNRQLDKEFSEVDGLG
jgi:ABC-type antimicrobial peptide transport system ATPase subunit